MDILRIQHLSKSFGKNQVIKDLSLAVPEGAIFGFIGQNGAGKTTTMRPYRLCIQYDFKNVGCFAYVRLASVRHHNRMYRAGLWSHLHAGIYADRPGIL